MLEKIRHFALTHWGSVHDEEALTALELQSRSVAKINEAVDVINKQIDVINNELDKVEDYAVLEVDRSIRDGKIASRLNDYMWENLNVHYAELRDRVDNLVLGANPAGADNAEIVDARTGAAATFPNLGNHVRALGTGHAFSDAVRPGTVRAGRLMAGMTGGDLRDKYTVRETIPMAGHWTGESGYFDAISLEFVPHDGYKMTDLFPCKYGDTFILESYLFGPLVRPAVIFDATKKCVGVLGNPGKSSWDKQDDEVHVGRGDAVYIAFVTGSGYQADFRAHRVSMKDATDRDAYGSARGYLHAYAKKRTDTITDRAQIKMWFPLPSDHKEDRVYHIPLQLLKYTNLGGWTLRLFGAASGKTYEKQLSTSANGYTFSTYGGLRPYFTVPEFTDEGKTITHVCLFLDLLPAREDEYMNVYICPPSLYWQGGDSDSQGFELHGHLDTDTLNVVVPGAASSPLYGKRILGIGDSLMSGNTLRKSKSWFNLAAGSRDMVHYNGGVNGRAIGGADGMSAHIMEYLNAFKKADYIIVQGGANDLRLNVSVDEFKAGLENILEYIKQYNIAHTKLLLMTNWRRSDYVNPLGHTEEDYVVAMMEFAEAHNIPCINNYVGTIDLTDEYQQIWADEGQVTTGEANLHFSEAGNKWLVPSIINALEGI